MYWVISGPDNNPLTGEVLFQQDTGLWSQAAPVISFLCSVFSIGVALYVAHRARQLTQQQRDIAEQGRQIAQDKLDLDVFDKRYKVISCYNKLFAKSAMPIIERKLSQEIITEFQEGYIFYKALFHIDDYVFFENAKSSLYQLMTFREEHNNRDHFFDKDEEQFEELYDECSIHIKILRDLIIQYSPSSLTQLPHRAITTTSPASHPAPQPTAPEQAQ